MSSSNDRARLRGLAGSLLGALILENLLGIFANLYLQLPSGNAIGAIFTSYPVLAVHVVLGLLMLALGLGIVLVAHRTGFRQVRNLAVAEVVFLALAIQEGFAFAATGDNAFSFGMEVGFVLSFAAVAGMLYRLGSAGPEFPTEGVPTSV
ncbi:MAG TPA: hypothetical protein VJQ43_03940 [Thermoplasmata archaeon]|nr:hypothetical protein [Thermoplasmata archaeon]